MSAEPNAEFHVNTDDVLKELEAEGFTRADAQVAEPETPEPSQEPTPEEVKEPTQEPKTEDDPIVIDRKSKEPTLIPAWKVKIGTERLERENAQLQRQIEALTSKPTVENRENAQAGVENIRALAEQSGIDITPEQEAFFTHLTESISRNVVPTETLQTLHALQHQQEVNYLEQQFDTEFTKDVLPLVKAQYGDITEGTLASLKKELHDKAFSEEYAKVALKKVFRAEQEELSLKPSKAPIHANRSGRTRNTEIDFSQMDEATFASLNDEQVDAYVSAQRTGRWNNTGR